AEGIEVLLGNGFDTAAFSPMLRALRPRVAVYNAHMWTLAGRHGCYMLDLRHLGSSREHRQLKTTETAKRLLS
ncbi:hypothetical protein CJ199_13685, partial [Brevibacterium paucivorans]